MFLYLEEHTFDIKELVMHPNYTFQSEVKQYF